MISAGVIPTSAVPPLQSWESVNWQKLAKWVRRMMQRIFRAERLGNKRLVRNLQRLLIRSQATLLLSIRKVTQTNKGKRTAGVDGLKVLTPQERVELYNRMIGMTITRHKPCPARRIYIPKKKGKLRPLGIPVIIDRVYQGIATMTLEPQWEARFEPNSYGFRPKRSTHDAIEAIFNRVAPVNSRTWIFEGDFRGCFDHLNHEFIMKQLAGFPYHGVINRWLKAGYVDNGIFHETQEGTPQGGIISPLLANIALHGMEEELGVTYRKTVVNNSVTYRTQSNHALVRYADDFVIICRTRQEAENMYVKLHPYLSRRGLELAEEKTRITHIIEGFNFLGFNVRKYKVNNDYKLLIKPSKQSVQKAKDKIKEAFRKMTGSNVESLIRKLNPIIQGYGYYWRHQVAKEIFSELDSYIFRKIIKFLKRLHPTKSWKWMKKRYFKPDIYGQSKDRWLLTAPDKPVQLTRMVWISIERHTLIKFTSSPYDPMLKDYFYQRNIKEFKSCNVLSKQKLAKRQNYLCPLCQTTILDNVEKLEKHRKIPLLQGGNNEYKNLQLVHASCHTDHHKKHPLDGSLPTASQLAKDTIERRKRREENTWEMTKRESKPG